MSILAMMFLVIFSSLAAAMAIVAQGNLSTAQSHMRINRCAAAAETGMQFVLYRLNQAARTVTTTDGVIDARNAPALWTRTRRQLLANLMGEFHHIKEPRETERSLHIGPIAVAPGEPTFTATFTPHPIPGEDYDSLRYQVAPYRLMNPPVSNTTPLDASWIRLTVVARDQQSIDPIKRSISVDIQMTRRLGYAILSNSRVMIGKHVTIEGDVGSRFAEVDVPNGHPVQMVSDFRGLDDELDHDLDAFTGSLIANDRDGDNRLNVHSVSETEGISDPQQYDADDDGYITDFDFFLRRFDRNADGQISRTELDVEESLTRRELFELIDTAGHPGREGYGDGVIDARDRYAKVRGRVSVSVAKAAWEEGAAALGGNGGTGGDEAGAYQDYFSGTIRPGHQQTPLAFESPELSEYDIRPSDFDVSSFRRLADGDFSEQATNQGGEPPRSRLVERQFEAVPYGAPYPYDFYDRPVYRDMTFENVTIPKGANALFVNCKFIGVTFVETETHNADANFNFAGVQRANGRQKYAGVAAYVDGQPVSDTKRIANNIRFDGCTFEGAVVSDAPHAFTHVRNKLTFTGDTKFRIDESQHLSPSEKNLLKRSAILAPHYSVEMGSFLNPESTEESVELSGTIVAGLIDLRGRVNVHGSILTTFRPRANVSPVIGDNSAQFNTTLGYFGSNDGDMETELPPHGLGRVHIRYDPNLPLPNGIRGPIRFEPHPLTWNEGG